MMAMPITKDEIETSQTKQPLVLCTCDDRYNKIQMMMAIKMMLCSPQMQKGPGGNTL